MPETNLDQLKYQSRDCPHCGGSGITVVYHRYYKGDNVIILKDTEYQTDPVTGRTVEVEVEQRIKGKVGADCDCPLGTHYHNTRTIPMPWLADAISGKSNYWLPDDPTEHNRPDTLVMLPGDNFQDAIARLMKSKRVPPLPKPKTTAQIAAELAERKEREYTSMAQDSGTHEPPRS